MGAYIRPALLTTTAARRAACTVAAAAIALSSVACGTAGSTTDLREDEAGAHKLGMTAPVTTLTTAKTLHPTPENKPVSLR